MEKISGDLFISQGPPRYEQIVETSGFRTMKKKLDLNIERNTGNILLVIGTRGIGKSTTLEYFKNYVNQKTGYDASRLLDVGLYFTQILDKEYNERIAYIFKKVALVLSSDKYDDINDVMSTLTQYKRGPFFLFIDNLDRLYQDKDDLGFVQNFFETADPMLKKLSEKVVVVISSAPEWSTFLQNQDLSYLNYTNSITLEQLSNDEVKKLIETRTKAQGFELTDIIEENLIPVIQVASRGNPRSLFQFLEKIINDVNESEFPINIETFQREVGSQLFDGAIEKLKYMASKSSEICWGINQLWRFFDILQKDGTDYGEAINKIDQIHEKSFILDSDGKLNKKAWTRIAHKKESDRWELYSNVRTMITKWYKETKVDKKILLTAYSQNLFTVSITEVEEYYDQYVSAIYGSESVLKIFNESFEKYMTIASKNESYKRIKVVHTGWKCIEQLMLTIIAICEGDIPKDLSLRLTQKETFEEAGHELIDYISDIYKTFGKYNPYRSELLSIIGRYSDVSENPEVATYWDSNQMDFFVKQVSNSYEGLLRSLKGSKLESSEHRKKSEDLRNMIRREENEELEFKSSVRWDYQQEKINKDLYKPALKTITAFLNTNGGNLIIGVNDNKKTVGIERDIYTMGRKDIDGYQQYLIDLIDKHIGSEICVYIKMSFWRIEGNILSVVSVEKSPYPIYLDSEFYIRAGNTTRQLEGESLNKYLNTSGSFYLI